MVLASFGWPAIVEVRGIPHGAVQDSELGAVTNDVSSDQLSPLSRLSHPRAGIEPAKIFPSEADSKE